MCSNTFSLTIFQHVTNTLSTLSCRFCQAGNIRFFVLGQAVQTEGVVVKHVEVHGCMVWNWIPDLPPIFSATNGFSKTKLEADFFLDPKKDKTVSFDSGFGFASFGNICTQARIKFQYGYPLCFQMKYIFIRLNSYIASGLPPNSRICCFCYGISSRAS